MAREYKIKKFNSIAEYDAWLSKQSPLPFYADNPVSQSEDSKFAGTASFDEANKLMLYGDTKLAKKVNKVVGTMRQKINASRPKKRMVQAVGGFMPNVPAYLSGAKKQMWRIQEKRVRDRVMTIVFNSAIHCGTTVNEAIETCATLMQAIMKIEAAGIRVNLYNAHYTADSSNNLIVGELIKIKDSGQYLDLLKMVYPMVNPSMHRRHHFKTIESLDERLGMCYGYPVRGGDLAVDATKHCGLRNVHLLSFYDVFENTIDETVNKIIESKI